MPGPLPVPLPLSCLAGAAPDPQTAAPAVAGLAQLLSTPEDTILHYCPLLRLQFCRDRGLILSCSGSLLPSTTRAGANQDWDKGLAKMLFWWTQHDLIKTEVKTQKDNKKREGPS